MTRPSKPPRYTAIARPDAIGDVASLAAYGPEVVAAAVAITDDFAHGRVIGQEFGDDWVALLWNPRWTAADNLENTTTVDLDGP